MMGIKDRLKSLVRGSRKKKERPPDEEWPGSVEILKEDDFEEFIEKYPVTLIDFHSPYCAPCRAMSPKIRKLDKRYKNQAAFGKVNVAEHQELGKEYGVSSVPTIIIFEWGVRKKFIVGKRSMADIRNTLDKVL